MNIQEAILHVVNKKNLTEEEMTNVMTSIMQKQTTSAQIAALLTALRMKGETIDELTAAAKVMRSFANPCTISNHNIIDIVGTGGDEAHTFNISTAVAFVVAAAGGFVAKHGNRSISSQCGSADVLEQAGININLTSEQISHCVDKIGIGFMFAPNYHSAMQVALAPRKEIGIRTLFNLLGPLTNPANAKCHLIGVYSQHWVLPIAQTLQKLGSTRAMVVHSNDGLDEISINAETYVAELKNGRINAFIIHPEQFGIKKKPLDTIRVKDSDQSLKLIQEVFNNIPGAARDIVILNAGAAMYIAELANTLTEAIKKAEFVIEHGLAKQKFEELIALSQELSYGSK